MNIDVSRQISWKPGKDSNHSIIAHTKNNANYYSNFVILAGCNNLIHHLKNLAVNQWSIGQTSVATYMV